MAKVTINVDPVIKDLINEMAAERGQYIEQFVAKAVVNEAKRAAAGITNADALEARLNKIMAVQEIAEQSRANKRAQAIKNLKKAKRVYAKGAPARARERKQAK